MVSGLQKLAFVIICCVLSLILGLKVPVLLFFPPQQFNTCGLKICPPLLFL